MKDESDLVNQPERPAIPVVRRPRKRPNGSMASKKIEPTQMRATILTRIRDNISTTSHNKAVYVYKCALFIQAFHSTSDTSILVQACEKLRNTTKSKDKANAIIAAQEVHDAWLKVVETVV